MPSPLRQIADDLAASLQAATLTVSPVTIERRNWAAIDIEQMAHPVVIVVPGGIDTSRIGRIDWQHDNAVTVFVGRHVATDADVDEMFDLADELLTHIRSHSLTGGVTTPQTVTVEINPDDAMTDRNVWRAVITATYRTLSSDTLPTE